MRYLKTLIGSMFVFVVLAGASCNTQTSITTESTDATPGEGAEVEFRDDMNTNDEASQPILDATTSATLEVPMTYVTSEDVSEADDASEQQPVAPQTRVIEMQAQRFTFEPSTITVNQGDTVVINFTSVDVTHGLNIPEFGVNLIAPVGETVTTQFVADTAGTFTFRCSVFCGSGHGTMQGTLVVQ